MIKNKSDYTHPTTSLSTPLQRHPEGSLSTARRSARVAEVSLSRRYTTAADCLSLSLPLIDSPPLSAR